MSKEITLAKAGSLTARNFTNYRPFLSASFWRNTRIMIPIQARRRRTVRFRD
ncbi:MAG: hypothetical protein SPI21_12370 [Hungatella hathewayi]|uniref:hypothetical protein n=1 Tax=Hungatella TaxID=1649459 RepID=UPI001FAB891C|nr:MULTISPECIES: hypothetical protein [Hungatella]MCI7382173.1 hypothetical protein [Hungatella sp.]MDY6237572.1 hypothetical protein [Hungatella hathewayi]